MALPLMSDGVASGMKTFQMSCHVLAPMDWAASMTPLSTSRRDCSIRRATKGAAATTRGTTVALLPMVVPTSQRVKGMMAIIRMRKGNDRVRFTMTSSTRKMTGCGRMPSALVMTRMTAMIIPNT